MRNKVHRWIRQYYGKDFQINRKEEYKTSVPVLNKQE